MKTYRVTASRTVRQEVSVTVAAESAREARELVLAQTIPAQWPDGHYVGDRGHFAAKVEATEIRTPK